MKLKNLTPHKLNFIDGTELKANGSYATIDWVDKEFERDGITLVKRDPQISQKQIEFIKEQLKDGEFGIVSFPVVSAVRGTELEGRVGSVIMKSRKEKVAYSNRFSI